ncbi:MAG: hypothetical protein LWW94_11300 [Candidatus Desulfofervidaceae bacterium]|nr:hypothetical protein [Candidatus Desulfofervidaceae bacterium]
MDISGLIIKFAFFLIKRYGDQRIKDLVFIETIIKETRELFRKDNIGKNELEDYHYQFKYYDSRLDKLVSSNCSEDEKLKIRHAILAARVLCWALRFETRPDSEIVKIMNERKNMIIRKGAYHSSYEVFMQKLVESGWNQDNDTKVNEYNISKVKEWCRANMDALQDLALKIKNQIKHADLFLEARKYLGF